MIYGVWLDDENEFTSILDVLLLLIPYSVHSFPFAPRLLARGSDPVIPMDAVRLAVMYSVHSLHTEMRARSKLWCLTRRLSACGINHRGLDPKGYSCRAGPWNTGRAERRRGGIWSRLYCG